MPSDLVSEVGHTCSCEPSDQIDKVELGISGVLGLLLQHIEHDTRYEVELVHQEVIRVNHLEPERLERPSWEVAEVHGDDPIGPTRERCRNHVTVIWIRESVRRLQGFPATDEGVLEGLVHRCKPLGDPFFGDIRADLLDGVLRFQKDPLRPQSESHWV